MMLCSRSLAEEYLMKKKIIVLVMFFAMVVGTCYFVNDFKQKENRQAQQRLKQLKHQQWSKNDYQNLMSAESLSPNKPYTSNQISMYLKIVHDHGKPVSRKTVKKGNIVETTAIWKNIKNHPNQKIILKFQGLHDESRILVHKQSSIW